MSQPDINNETGFALQPMLLTDESCGDLLVIAVKATFRIVDSTRLAVCEEQVPVNLPGEYWGTPGQSSWKYEPETAFVKTATDVVLIGSAFAPTPSTTQVDVRLCVGRVSKVARIFGDRYWYKTFGHSAMSPAQPFESMPLVYERAYGGSETGNDNCERLDLCPANPVGTGWLASRSNQYDGLMLPNIEDPRHLIAAPADQPNPVGFGYVSPDWQPRSSLAGTYDEKWLNERMPLLPYDFNRRFFNAASAGLVYPGFLRNDEDVLIENVSPGGVINFSLPKLEPPDCHVELHTGVTARVQMEFDTLIINTDDCLVLLIWRGHIPIKHGPLDIRGIRAQASCGAPQSELSNA